MIFTQSLPLGKTFFAAVKLPPTTVGLLMRFLVASLGGLHSAAGAADVVRTDPRHRAQLVRFLAREGWSANWETLRQVADLLLQSCQHEKGTWLFTLDQTYHTTCGQQAQNSFRRGNKKQRARQSARRQKKTAKHSCHCFVFGLLISPETGTRLPCVRSYYTKEYCREQAAQAKKKGRKAPTFLTQADIAAEMVRELRVPPGSKVLVLGDTAFEAEQIRAACQQRGFDWIVPANPERKLAGKKSRRALKDRSKDLGSEGLTRIDLCPGTGAWCHHQRGCQPKAGREKYARRYWACAETLDVHNIGNVRCVFSTTKQPQAGQAVEIQKILLSNRTDWDVRQVVAAYAARWQIELFFKEMKSNLGLSSYRMRNFREVEGWVQACCIAFVYLEWYRLQMQGEAKGKDLWWRQRVSGLARQVLRDIEWADLLLVAEKMETEEGRRWLQDALRRAAPLELRKAI